jgi:hypothetical protein
MTEETDFQESETLDVEETTETNESENDGEVTTEPTLEDYQKLEKTNKNLFARLKKAEQIAKSAKTNKTNEQSGLTREEAILFAKGLTEEEIDLASKLAKVNGTTLLKATEDNYFKTKIEERLSKERSIKASLGGSSGSALQPAKPIAEMSRAEHIEYTKKLMS